MKITSETLIPISVVISLLVGASYVGASIRTISQNDESIAAISQQISEMNQRLSRIEGQLQKINQ